MIERLTTRDKQDFCDYYKTKQFRYLDFLSLYSRALSLQQKIFKKYLNNQVTQDDNFMHDYQVLDEILKWICSKMPMNESDI